MLKDRVKKVRESLNLTQLDLAKKIGVSAAAVGMYEQGRRDPDTEMLKKIAIALGTTTDYLLELTEVNDRAVAIEKNDEELNLIISEIMKNNLSNEDLKYFIELKKTMKKLPSFETVKKITSALDISIDDLLRYKEMSKTDIENNDPDGKYKDVMIEAIDSGIAPEQLRTFVMYWKDSKK